MTRRLWIVLGYAAVVVGSRVGARYPADWWLEHLVVFAAAAGVAVAWRRGFVFSERSLLCMALLGALHAYGAHSTYSETPLGNLVRDHFDLARNHYDRAVHFAFGLLMALPLREIALRSVGARGGWSYVLPVIGALAISTSYELLESWAARIAAPDLGIAYLGTQGDVWDAQKDTTAALVGAALALGAIALSHGVRRSQAEADPG